MGVLFVFFVFPFLFYFILFFGILPAPMEFLVEMKSVHLHHAYFFQ